MRDVQPLPMLALLALTLLLAGCTGHAPVPEPTPTPYVHSLYYLREVIKGNDIGLFYTFVGPVCRGELPTPILDDATPIESTTPTPVATVEPAEVGS